MARVLLDSPVPHLDREFDYLIPREMDAEAQPGVRVKVRFGHRDVTGWLIDRTEDPSTGAKLQPLRRVVSAERVLTPEVLALARVAARRYAGTTADVLRLALPPRVAKVEKELREAQMAPEATDQSGVTDTPSGAEAEETLSEPASQRAPIWSELSGERTSGARSPRAGTPGPPWRCPAPMARGTPLPSWPTRQPAPSAQDEGPSSWSRTNVTWIGSAVRWMSGWGRTAMPD